MPNSEKQILYRQLGFEACYLAACALHDTVPQLHGGLDLEKLYRFCKFHSITSIVAMALEKAWAVQRAEDAIMNKWRQARDKTIRKNILLNAERERILSHLESIGCWYMPLKGSLLQFDYPQFGMRQMSDNDILFDQNMTHQVHDFMIADGYEAVTFCQGNHDEYVKKPLYNIEMHRDLFMKSVNPELAAYYQNVKERLVKDENTRFGYHMTHEDFYIFMVAHAYKHYLHGGVGIRNLLDDYVFVSKYGSELNWEYLQQELKKIGAWEFDQECRLLGKKLFCEPGGTVCWSDQETAALNVYFTSGAFGTAERVVENRLNAVKEENEHSHGKLRYVLKRMFPSVEYLAENAPVLRKMPWLAPLFYVKRFISVLFSRRHYVLRELRNLLKLKK